MKKLNFLIAIGIILLLITGCSIMDMPQARDAFAPSEDEKIVMGVPGPLTYMKEITGFYNGVMMAVEEINAKGGIKGRLLEARFEDDKGTFNDGLRVAQEFVSQRDMVAVIGHWNTYITLPAARIYNDAGMLMLSPIVSNPTLTQMGYQYVFQNIINDTELGRQMAEYVTQEGYKRIVVLYADNDYGKGLSTSFENYISDQGGQVIDRLTEFVNDQEFNRAYDKWAALDYDAVFIADSMPHAEDFIKRIRKKDAEIPIFAGDGLDFADLPSMLGEAGEGIVVASMYNSEANDDQQKMFIDTYKKKYNSQPDVWAVQGYDSIKLLSYAIDEAETPTSSNIADVLQSDMKWRGIMGEAKFNPSGEIIGRQIYKKIIRNGKMEYLKPQEGDV